MVKNWKLKTLLFLAIILLSSAGTTFIVHLLFNNSKFVIGLELVWLCSMLIWCPKLYNKLFAF